MLSLKCRILVGWCLANSKGRGLSLWEVLPLLCILGLKWTDFLRLRPLQNLRDEFYGLESRDDASRDAHLLLEQNPNHVQLVCWIGRMDTKGSSIFGIRDAYCWISVMVPCFIIQPMEALGEFSGNPMISTRCTLGIIHRLMSNTKSCYPSANNYELMLFAGRRLCLHPSQWKVPISLLG